MNELENMTPEELGHIFPIILQEYDPAWKERYEAEKRQILALFSEKELVRISHIGSTAIPGLMSKPSIDILLEVAGDLPDSRIKGVLTSIGYRYIRRQDNPPPHMMFVKGYTPEGFRGQAFHVHVRYGGDWDEIRFRDYLKANGALAAEYAQLKRRLAQQYRNDREGYTEAKTEFIEKVIAQARNEF